jgi:hypothetical protein
MAAERRRFRFVQWEFPGRLGPDPGRYVVRRFAGDDARQVVIIAGIEAPRRRRRSGRRAVRAEAGAGPPPVEVTRATVISTDPLPDDDRSAREWLANAAGEQALQTVGEALRLLNLAVHGHRLAAADPYVAEVGSHQAIAVRVGYGSGEQVADGRWEAARELPPADHKGTRLASSPQERLGALLSGRDVALACEELALRARLDLDQGRGREAALQVRVALETAIAELEGWRGSDAIAVRIDELGDQVEPLEAAAAAALKGGLQPAELAAVETALGRLEAALRARSAAS